MLPEIEGDAGNGNVRIINCVARDGLLIPQYKVIIHSLAGLDAPAG